jgi:hypothetical protein
LEPRFAAVPSDVRESEVGVGSSHTRPRCRAGQSQSRQ